MLRKFNLRLGVMFVIVLIALTAGCGQKQKEEAQQAINAAQAMINEVQEEAQKYVPEQLHDAQTVLQHAKDELQNKDYPAALSAAQDALNKAKAVARQTLGKQEQWTNLNDSITKSLEDAKKKLDSYANGEHLPKGMTKGKVKEMQGEYDQLKQKWENTWEHSRAGALQKGQEVKDEVEKLKEKLGIN